MNSELFSFIRILGLTSPIECISDESSDEILIEFDCNEHSFMTLQKFLELYKVKSDSIVDMQKSSRITFELVELLELYILQRCDKEENIIEFLNELRNYTIYSDDELDRLKEDWEEFEDLKYKGNIYAEFADDFLLFEFPKDKIANWYMKLLNRNPVLMQNSRIFNDERMNNLFSSEQLKEIATYKEKMKKIALKTYAAYMSFDDLYELHDILPDANVKQLLDYILLNLDEDNPEIFQMKENIIQKVMNDLGNASNAEKEFVLKCFAHDKCKANGISPANIIFAENIKRSFLLGNYIGNTNIINIYSGRVRAARTIEEFAKCIRTINHEIEHYIQWTDKTNGKFSFRGYISSMDDFLGQYIDYFNYKNNYSYCEIEQHADFNAYNDTINIIKKYYTGDLSFLDSFHEKGKNKSVNTENLGYHLDYVGKIESRGQFNIKALIDVVSKKPKVLEKYPIFKKFFNNDGTMKTIEILAKDYHASSDEEKLIYSDLIEYLFTSTKLLSSLDLSLFSDDLSKIGFLEMLKFDVEKKLNKLVFVSENLNNLPNNSSLCMDVKKFYYEIADLYSSSIEDEYVFLENVTGTFVDTLELKEFLEESREKVKSISNGDLFLYSGTSERLNRIVSNSTPSK